MNHWHSVVLAGMGEHSYNNAVEEFRDREYPMLKDSIYLDHAGTTLYSKSLIDRFAAEMMSNLLGNPHSGSPSSQHSTFRIEDIRLRLLDFFHADPADYDLVFVANATAGIKLVLEALRAAPDGFLYAHHQACHTSLVGVREEARDSICIDDVGVESWIHGETPFPAQSQAGPALLFSYTAQSHMDGTRYPLSWSGRLRDAEKRSARQFYTLLDAASFAATSQLDLSDATTAPDFTVLSLYKIFGFPDLGALIVRRQAETAFKSRKYFGGGTVDMVVCGREQWHASKSQSLHERLEDGTLPFHSIIALDFALSVHRDLFGTMARVGSHTSYLALRMLNGLSGLKHANGTSVCTIYSRHVEREKEAVQGKGPVVSFNVRNASGAWVSLAEFEKLATLKCLHIRTGGLCSPGGIASALGLEPWEIKKNFSSGFRCGAENDLIAGKPTGVIRASLGAMSTISDVDRFIAFVDEFYREDTLVLDNRAPLNTSFSSPGLTVQGITVYPIKSCGGYVVPPGMPWEVRPEGLAWDREWCLVHQGSGQALSQKRYPKMALIRPSLDFDLGMLRISFHGPRPKGCPEEISVPLSANPTLFDSDSSFRTMPSRVCGDVIAAQTYTVAAINTFFSEVLNVPCVLARFPAGGHGGMMRQSKAQVQNHQRLKGLNLGSDLPTPPDSDSEQHKSKILLSNESPILLVNTASLLALNREIKDRGGESVPAMAFRANVVIGPTTGESAQLAYAEDLWTSVRIGSQYFKFMGSCRRCQMVCINQESGEKHQEPFVTLAKTRRFDGKVYFGTHMCHDPKAIFETQGSQYSTIRVGDVVEVDVTI